MIIKIIIMMMVVVNMEVIGVFVMTVVPLVVWHLVSQVDYSVKSKRKIVNIIH